MARGNEERIAELEQRVKTLEQIVRELQDHFDGMHDPRDHASRVAWTKPQPAVLEAPDGVDAEVAAQLRAGNKIMAIKRLRELTGMGLADAKREAERLAELLGV